MLLQAAALAVAAGDGGIAQWWLRILARRGKIHVAFRIARVLFLQRVLDAAWMARRPGAARISSEGNNMRSFMGRSEFQIECRAQIIHEWRDGLDIRRQQAA
jgi:hypothetical protein